LNCDLAEFVNYLSSEKYVWLAASDIGRRSGDFYWSNGKPVASELWHKSAERTEPNSVKEGQQTCVYLWANYDSLGDWKCDDTEANLLCQLPDKYNYCLV
jgi:hypothetical protein